MKAHEEGDMGTSLPNVIPLVEIFLFILLVTIGTAAAQQHELLAKLAQVKAAALSERPGPTLFIQISRDRDGKVVYRAQGEEVSLAKVEARIREGSAAEKIYVEPEATTPWDHIAPVLSAAYAANRVPLIRVVEKKEATP